jgi:hypothetical protein
MFSNGPWAPCFNIDVWQCLLSNRAHPTSDVGHP